MTELKKYAGEVKQSNVFTQARFNYTKIQIDLLTCIVYALKNTDFKENRIDLSLELIKKYGTGDDVKRWHIVQALEGLMNKKAKIKTGQDVLAITLISAFNYIHNAGRVIIEVPAMSLQYYRPLENEFTLYQLGTSLSFKSKHTKRLYQLLSQFKQAGSWRVGITELKEQLGLIDEDGKEKLKSYTSFTETVLDVATEEINNSGCDITCKWEKKTSVGKKVTELIFFVYPQQIKSSRGFRNEELYIQLTNKFKLSAYQADTVYMHLKPEKIIETLKPIAEKLRLNELHNVGGYTAKKFKELFNLPYTI